MKIDFQHNLPVFVKHPKGMIANGMIYKKGDEYKWLSKGIDAAKVRVLYNADLLYHNSELEVEKVVGDGLDGMSLTELHTIVESINSKVKPKCKEPDGTFNQVMFDKKKCTLSKIATKQVGHIRRWRSVHKKSLGLDMEHGC